MNESYHWNPRSSFYSTAYRNKTFTFRYTDSNFGAIFIICKHGNFPKIYRWYHNQTEKCINIFIYYLLLKIHPDGNQKWSYCDNSWFQYYVPFCTQNKKLQTEFKHKFYYI